MNSLYTAFQSLRWQDFIDIIINSYILFRIYVLFRGTTIFRVMAGIAGLLLLQQIAASLGLVVTSWLIQGLTAVAAIIIIIIFQNEIRGVFQTTNWKSLLWGLPTSSQLTPSETIAQAIFEMAENRTGALIVFPGKDNLDHAVQRGVVWGGRVSKEMLKTIFYHNNPVHDGAVILEGDRITDVACILPLSERTDLPSQFGTRHRAAVGLAERTDALVVVVSEERGNVTAVKGGSIARVRQTAELIRMIDTHLGREEQKRWYQQEAFQLSLAGIFSLILIASVWNNFSRSADTLINLEAPIQFKNRRGDIEVVAVSENAVSLQISGSTALLRTLGTDKPYVDINLADAKIGENTFTLSTKNISLPPGITLNQINPSTVTVLLDIIITKELPVQVDWVGKLPRNMLMPGVKINPARVRLTGRSLLLDKRETVYTRNVPLDRISASGTATVELDVKPPLELTGGQPDTVKITYTVEKR